MVLGVLKTVVPKSHRTVFRASAEVYAGSHRAAVMSPLRRDTILFFHFSDSCLQVLDNAIETEKMIEKYESLASDLLEWIEQTIIILNNRKFANSLVGVQQQLQAFNTYRTVEKPPK